MLIDQAVMRGKAVWVLEAVFESFVRDLVDGVRFALCLRDL